mgnify:CR=1 FL=1
MSSQVDYFTLFFDCMLLSIKEKSASTDSFKNILEANGSRPVPTWLERNSDANTAKVINLPDREQIEAPIEEHLIVEFYSK